jgi:outer membrane receptor for ferrienterochelin and colicin
MSGWTPRPFQLSEIVVRDDRPAIDPTSTTFGANLATEEFEVLPIDRDYRSIVALLPQANTSYLGDGVNIAGATGLGNVYFIDGVNVTDPSLAATSTRLPYNFVKEIQVKEGGYEAEFGKALGGIVNVVTLSGGNEFRAGAFAYLTNGALATDGRPGLLELTLRDFATYDVGLSVSGPLLRDRLWFFVAYNPSFETQELELPGFGFHDDRLISHRFASKLTWQPSQNTSVMFTAFGDPTRHHQVGFGGFGEQNPARLLNPDPLLSFSRRGSVSLSLQTRTVLGSRAIIEGSIARTEHTQDNRGDTERAMSEPRFQDRRTNTWSGGVAAQGSSDITRTSARTAATMFFGTHTVKAGVEYEENAANQMSATNGPGIIEQLGDAAFFVNRIDSA